MAESYLYGVTHWKLQRWKNYSFLRFGSILMLMRDIYLKKSQEVVPQGTLLEFGLVDEREILDCF